MKKTSLRLLACAVSLGLSASAADTNIIAWGTGGVTSIPELPTNAIAVTGGDTHGIALLADRTVRTWGSLAYGAGSVVPPAGLTDVVGIAAGSAHALALRDDGTVVLWGRILGNGTTQVSPAATNVVALGVGPGAQHALALRADGTVVDWGLALTTNIPPDAFNIVSVAAGARHSLALRSDGRMIAWGEGASVPANATNIVAIATTWHGNMALRADGKILTWGSSPNIPNSSLLTDIIEVAGSGGNGFGGGLALSRTGRVFSATAPAAATNITAIGGSGSAFLAVKAVGPPIFPYPAVRRTVASGQTAYLRHRAVGALPLSYQWSFQGTNLPAATNAVLVVTNVLPARAGFYSLVVSNAFGVITNTDMQLAMVPIIIARQPTNQAVYVGANPTLRVTALGPAPVYQWSFNGTNISSATNNSLTLTNIQLAQAGMYFVTVSNEFGGVVSSNAFLTVEPILVTQSPKEVVTFEGGNALFSITALASAPLSYQWQFNGTDLTGATASTLTLTNVQYAQAGVYRVIATATDAVVTNSGSLSVLPVAAWGSDTYGRIDVPTNLASVMALAAGAIHNLALHKDGTVTAWRYDIIQTNLPANLTNVIAISADASGSLALRADGSVVAWGYNYQGQTNLPPDLTNIVAVAAGGYHNLVLRADGTVVAWGQNNSGQASVPAGLAEVVAINAHGETSLALTAGGQVVAWGYNGTGKTNVPTDLSSVVAVAAGDNHCIALRSDGTVRVWGWTNSYGLGKIPAAATNIVSVGAGYGHCLALKDDGIVIAWGYHYDGQTNVPAGLRNVTAIAVGDSHSLALVGDISSTFSTLPTNPNWSSSGFNVTTTTLSGKVYRLEHKDNLSDGAWTAHALVAGTGGLVTFTDSTATGSQRFYRVRRW